MMMKRLSIAMAALLVAGGVRGASAGPDRIRHEQERLEDLRMLHRYAIQDLHDAKTLAGYLRGWGGADREPEVETHFQEAEDVMERLRGVDHGGMALQVCLDAFGTDGVSPAHLGLVRRARITVTPEVLGWHRRATALKSELAEQVRAQATEKIRWELRSDPEPWDDPSREADRAAGLRRGITLDAGFFALPADQQAYTLAKAARAGVQYIAIADGTFSDWAHMEPEPGVYDFAALDTAIAAIVSLGMQVCPMLSTLSGSPPQWWVEERGEVAYVGLLPPRTRGGQEEWVGINLFDTPTGEAFRRFLNAYARHLATRWGDRIDGLYVQHRHPRGQAEIEAPLVSDTAMDAYWRRWSQTDTPWRAPEAIVIASEADRADFVRAEQCREQWLLDYVAVVTESLKAGWPAVRVQTQTVNDDFHRLFEGAVGRSRDLYRLAQATDNPGTKSSSAASLHLIRSLAGERWLWMFGMHSGCGTIPSTDFAQAPFFGVSRIDGGPFIGRFTRMRYPQSWFRYQDGQFGGFGIGSYIAVPRRSQELAPVILNTRALPADVAILWSQSSLRLGRKNQAAFRSAIAWGHLLARAQIPYDYIAEGGLAEGLQAYRVLILPETYWLPATAVRTITDWVRQGGALMGFGAPGRFDEYGRERDALPLADVFGGDLARMRVPGPIQPDRLETTHPEGAYVFQDRFLPPQAYKFEMDLTAALRPTTGTPRAWFAGEDRDVAIIEHTYGEGRALLSGFPLGYEYWQSAPYECANGVTHHRATNYNHEQKRYERWIAAELAKFGVVPRVSLPNGLFLRTQTRDDPDWFHVVQLGPTYREYMFEQEAPVRTVLAFARQREGIDNLYIGLAHTEGNYFWERGYFRSTLSGALVTVSVGDAGESPVVFDARLEVPVPIARRAERIEFTAWLPKAQGSAFAVAPTGAVRLFGQGIPSGVAAADLVVSAGADADGAGLDACEVYDLPAIDAFLETLRDQAVIVGYGDTRYQVAAEALAALLHDRYGIEARNTAAMSRITCRHDYMNGFGWPRIGPEPVEARILIGNVQDNALMLRYHRVDQVSWMPLEVNRYFPGIGRAIVGLSSPVVSDANGQIRRKDAPRQLIIGASAPAEALMAVERLIERLPGAGTR